MVDHAILPADDAWHRDSDADDIEIPRESGDDGLGLTGDGIQDAFETPIRVLVQYHLALLYHLGAGRNSSDDDSLDTDRYGQGGDAIGAQLDDVGRSAGRPQVGGPALGYQATSGQVVDEGGDGAAIDLEGLR
jgi:hypothetical protein